MSFVPPDGHFVLSEYRYAPSSSNANSALAKFRGVNPSSPVGVLPSKEVVPLPFAIKAKFEIEDTAGTKSSDPLLSPSFQGLIKLLFLYTLAASFNVTFSSRLTTRPIENVVVELSLGEGAHAIKCVASRESGGLGRGLSSLETGMSASSTASWAFDSRKKVRPLSQTFIHSSQFELCPVPSRSSFLPATSVFFCGDPASASSPIA